MCVPEKAAGRIRRAISLLLLAASFSCTSPEGMPERNFRTVSSYLESGGPVYAVAYLPDLVAAGEKEIAEAREAMWQQPLSPEQREKFDRVLTLAELRWKLSGISGFSGLGCSSAALPGNGGFFRNRLFFALSPDAEKGIVQNLLWETDEPFPLRPEDLPDACFFACAAHLRPDAFWNALKSSGKMGEEILFQSREGFPLPWEEALYSSQGWWTFAIADGNEGPGVRMEIPDRDGNLSRMVRNVCLCGEWNFREEKEGRLLMREKNLSALVLLEPGKIVFFSPAEAEEFFLVPERKREEKPEKDPFAEVIPEQGIAFAFARKKFYFPARMPLLFRSFSSVFPDGEVEEFCGALTREKEGYLWDEKGKLDWLRKVSPNPVKLLNLFLWDGGEAAPEESPADGKKVPQTGKERQEKMADCRSGHLRKAGEAMLRLRREDGSFPEGDALSLFRKLLEERSIGAQDLLCPGSSLTLLPEGETLTWKHCSYCCFPWDGKGFQGKPRPLLMDRPGNHPDAFNVFFTDGTVKTFQLSHPDSCRRLIAHLYTLCRWPEEEFRRLMQQAEQLDQEMKGE